MEVITMNCPGCGASVTTRTKKCEYCRKDILIQSFRSFTGMATPEVNKYLASYKATSVEHPNHSGVTTSIGLCFLKLKKYDQALEQFEKAQSDNFEDPTPFFYAAVARLKGRKPFLCSRDEINQMETDIKAAMSIAPSAEQLYFLSYIGRDYFKRKYLNHKPSWESLMEEAVDNGLSPADVEEFHAMIGTPVDISLD